MREALAGVQPKIKLISVDLAIPGEKMKRGFIVDKVKINFRTYRGVAGIIRRRIIFAVAFALVYGTLAIFLGFLLRSNQIFNLPDTFLITGLLFVIGLLINGWLVLRLMRKPLEAIEQVEDGLVEMASSGEFKLLHDHDMLDFNSTPFLQAYHGMLDHIDSLETNYLEFLEKIAHDIRAPVASILGYAELLTDSDMRHNEKFIDQTYEVIRRQGNQVCQLLEDAVLATEVDTEDRSIKIADIELDEFLGCVASDEAKRLQREIHFENQAGRVLVHGDPLSLQIAFRNLVDNGVKYSKPGQPVYLRLLQAQNPGWIEIQVEDHGIGIEEKDQATLFRRFSRIHNDHTSSIPGTGLGLYIARRIIEKHGGSIQLESKIDEGSIFTIRLRAADALIKGG